MQSQYLAHSKAAQGIPTYFKLLLNCFSPELFANVHLLGGEGTKMGFLYPLVSYMLCPQCMVYIARFCGKNP